MLCEEMMSREVVAIGVNDSVQTAAIKMRESDVGFLPVVDPQTQRVLGVVTDRDIAIRLVADDLPAYTRVSAVMSHELVTCRPSDDVISAERLMGKRQKSRILCIDEDDRLCGVISLSDIASLEAEARVAETMRQVTRRESRAAQ